MPLKCEKWVRIPFGPQVNDMRLQAIHSRAQKLFKKQIGQANHFLITILVGLTEVSKGTVQKPATMNVMWNPKDPKASSLRSMRYALNSSLAWAVDNLDGYIQMCRKKPCLIPKDIMSKIDEADRSVYEKFCVLSERYKDHGDLRLYGALVSLAIQWRNVTTHSNADNELDKKSQRILLDNSDWYKNNFKHLDVDMALKRFKRHSNPSLKEVASMIKAISRFVEEVDAYLINDVNIESYALDVVDFNFSSKAVQGKQDQRTLLPTMKLERQLSKIKMVLENNGFTMTQGEGLEINEDFVKKVVSCNER